MSGCENLILFPSKEKLPLRGTDLLVAIIGSANGAAGRVKAMDDKAIDLSRALLFIEKNLPEINRFGVLHQVFSTAPAARSGVSYKPPGVLRCF